MTKLANKVAVITGGTTGIGFATAKLFADEGARVIVTGRSPATLESARAELSGRAEVVAADATQATQRQALFEHIRNKYGRIDVLFINAGGGTVRPLDAVDESYFDELISLNLKSAYFSIQGAVPLLAPGASIVLNTSITAVKAFNGTSVYAAAKAGLRQLARSLGNELLERGIRVNAVSPGPIDTPIHDKLGLSEEGRAAFRTQVHNMSPMKRFGKPEEVAHAVLFLASDAASYITGAELAVDGGVTNF